VNEPIENIDRASPPLSLKNLFLFDNFLNSTFVAGVYNLGDHSNVLCIRHRFSNHPHLPAEEKDVGVRSKRAPYLGS
jgi:hypothetical protein